MNTYSTSGNFMNKSKFILVIFVVVIGLSSYLYIDQGSQQSSGGEAFDRELVAAAENSPEGAVTESNAKPAAMPVRSPSAQASDLDNSENQIEPWYTAAGIEQLEKWKVSRGYFSDVDMETYKSYDPEVIRQLAKGGDIRALYVLARLQVGEGAPKEEIISTFLDAAVQGSSYALGAAGMFAVASPNAVSKNSSESDDQFKGQMLESLSLFQATLIRGDRGFHNEMKSARSSINLTAEDEHYIERRGVEIYKELEAKRIEHGLGPFDNSVPPLVNQYYDAEENRFLPK